MITPEQKQAAESFVLQIDDNYKERHRRIFARAQYNELIERMHEADRLRLDCQLQASAHEVERNKLFAEAEAIKNRFGGQVP